MEEREEGKKIDKVTALVVVTCVFMLCMAAIGVAYS